MAGFDQDHAIINTIEMTVDTCHKLGEPSILMKPSEHK
jgi:hypothetical protein